MKDKFYDTKIKLINGKNSQSLEIRKYSSLLSLGSKQDNIDNLEEKIKELKDSNPSIAIAIQKREEDSNSVENAYKNVEKEKKIRVDNILRSRNKVFDLASENYDKWNSFITLTFQENLTDIDIAYKNLKSWIRQVTREVKKEDKDFYYLGVIEFQKRGAIHYHLLTNLECGSYLLPKQENKENMFDVKYWKHGFTSAFDIKKNTDNNFNVSKYMCKYMTKKNDDDRLLGHRRYYHSRNLKKPLEMKCMHDDYRIDRI